MGDAGAPRWGEAAGRGGGGRRVRVGDLGGVRGNEQGHEGHDARELAHGGVCGAADGADEGCRGGEEIGRVRVGAAVGAAANSKRFVPYQTFTLPGSTVRYGPEAV